MKVWYLKGILFAQKCLILQKSRTITIKFRLTKNYEILNRGEEFIHKLLVELPNDKTLTLIIVLAIMFLLGFILDFIEITFIVIPLIGPALFTLGFDPLWLGILIALVLQTSFITPPFGFSLFYLRGVLPSNVKTIEIYKGLVPFLIIQVILMICVFTFPSLATFLPELLLK